MPSRKLPLTRGIATLTSLGRRLGTQARRGAATFGAAAFALAMTGLLSGGAAAQGLFAPHVHVNDSAITGFEIEQRVALFEVLNTPGDLHELALQRLIDERLQMQAARRAGLRLDEEDIAVGMEEFASRAEMSAEEFIAALQGEGVDPATFRDFVAAGLTWRTYVQGRFGPRIIVTDSEIDRALQLYSQRGPARVLLSEIFLPTDPQFAAQVAEIERQIVQIRSIEEFSQAARMYSAAPTAQQGGRIEWLELANLPEPLAEALITASPGTVVGPVRVPGAVGYFQLRALEASTDISPASVQLSYMRYLIPGGRSEEAQAEAARIAARVDRCNDLYGIAHGEAEERLIVTENQNLPQVPTHLALELAKLDAGESSTALTEGDALVFLMLCSRHVERAEPPSRNAVAEQLYNHKLMAHAEVHLDELRAEAHIRHR